VVGPATVTLVALVDVEPAVVGGGVEEDGDEGSVAVVRPEAPIPFEAGRRGEPQPKPVTDVAMRARRALKPGREVIGSGR